VYVVINSCRNINGLYIIFVLYKQLYLSFYLYLDKTVPSHSIPNKVNILTFIMVLLHTGTNFPAVSVKPLLAVAMMKTRQR